MYGSVFAGVIFNTQVDGTSPRMWVSFLTPIRVESIHTEVLFLTPAVDDTKLRMWVSFLTPIVDGATLKMWVRFLVPTHIRRQECTGVIFNTRSRWYYADDVGTIFNTWNRVTSLRMRVSFLTPVRTESIQTEVRFLTPATELTD